MNNKAHQQSSDAQYHQLMRNTLSEIVAETRRINAEPWWAPLARGATVVAAFIAGALFVRLLVHLLF